MMDIFKYFTMWRWKFGFEKDSIKGSHKDNKNEKVTEEIFDFQTGIKTTKKKDIQYSNEQKAKIDRSKFGAFTNTKQSSSRNADEGSKSLVLFSGEDRSRGIGYKKEIKRITSVKESSAVESDSDEEVIDPKIVANNPRLLRKRTRKIEGTSETGIECVQTNKIFGIF